MPSPASWIVIPVAATLLGLVFQHPPLGQAPAPVLRPKKVTTKLTQGAAARADDNFGRSVAVDGGTLVVGIPEYDVAGMGGNGAIAVYRRIAKTWTQTDLLIASDTDVADVLGENVAISGDVLIGSAANEGLLDPGAVWAGATYVWEELGGVWTETGKLIPSDAIEFHETGFAGDVDGPTRTVVVGARNDCDKGQYAGSAYVFRKLNGTWTQAQELHAADPQPGDAFGYAVAIEGFTLAVSTPYTDDPYESTGTTYVFEDSGSGFVQVAKLKASDLAWRNHFGSSVDLEGDLLVVGSSRADNGIPGSVRGAAYVFRRDGSSWSQVAKLVPGGQNDLDAFGSDVSLRAGLIAVGATGVDQVAQDAGAAYVFAPAGGAWSQVATLLAADGAAGDQFGGSVGLEPPLVLVGAQFHDSPVSNAGAAYVVEYFLP